MGCPRSGLYYRIDPATNYTRLGMSNNGAGYYSATVPGQVGGAVAAFYLEAADGPGATARFPQDAPTRECLVRWGETTPQGKLPIVPVLADQGADRSLDRPGKAEQ